jgi:HTH-type transcriptional regulator/antitoxin MqsA
MSIYGETCAGCGGRVSVSCDPMTVQLRGATITVRGVEHGTCEQCGEGLLDPAGADLLQRDSVRQLRQTKGLLTSDEIRKLRQSLGLSQAAFEHLLGTGSKTVVRWEKGTVFQSSTADRLMRVMREMPEVVEVLRSLKVESLPNPAPRP